jgi:superfamily II RNA helicase
LVFVKKKGAKMSEKNRRIVKFEEANTQNEIKNTQTLDYYPNEEKNPFAWQSKCLNSIKNENYVILSSPTGTGKTNVFMKWAIEKGNKPIYITAPIKALSNQRYKELKEAGLNVGIETGDVKNVSPDNDIICLTQEIYTAKYADVENATLIMDEFHYIFAEFCSLDGLPSRS